MGAQPAPSSFPFQQLSDARALSPPAGVHQSPEREKADEETLLGQSRSWLALSVYLSHFYADRRRYIAVVCAETDSILFSIARICSNSGCPWSGFSRGSASVWKNHGHRTLAPVRNAERAA